MDTTMEKIESTQAEQLVSRSGVALPFLFPVLRYNQSDSYFKKELVV